MSSTRTYVRSVLRTMSHAVPRTIATAGFLIVSGATVAGAQTATQIVRFRVVAQSRAEVAPLVKPISMSSAKSGASTSALTLSTNDVNLKVTASIDRSMPAGTSLAVAVGNAPRGSSADAQRLGTDATDVLTGISATDSMRIPIAYEIATDGEGASRDAQQRLVTYTVLAAP